MISTNFRGCAAVITHLLGIDNVNAPVFKLKTGATNAPTMTQKNNRKHINEVRIKFVAPEKLKEGLQVLANERNITLSALLRLITTEYIKRNQVP